MNVKLYLLTVDPTKVCTYVRTALENNIVI